MIGQAMLLERSAVMQVGPVSNEELRAVTYFLNVTLISAIMLLVFIAILHKEITRRNSAAGIIEIEEDGGGITELGPNRIAIGARLVVRNRSSIPARIRRIDYSMYIDSRFSGKSSQVGGVTIPPGPPITLARTLDLSLKTLGPIPRYSETHRPPCRIVGVLHVETGCGDARVPFNFEAIDKVVSN